MHINTLHSYFTLRSKVAYAINRGCSYFIGYVHAVRSDVLLVDIFLLFFRNELNIFNYTGASSLLQERPFMSHENTINRNKLLMGIKSDIIYFHLFVSKT